MPVNFPSTKVPALLLLLALSLPVSAATVNLFPNADTTLSNFDPNNNFGASHHLMSGGLARSPRPTRMLARFDIAGAIPPG